MDTNKSKAVLNAKFIGIKNKRFYYQIEGNENLKNDFREQEQKYTEVDMHNNLLYSTPWYYGLNCPICRGAHSKDLFLNINEHEQAASKALCLGTDYWKVLAETTNDNNWLSRSKKDK